MGMTPGSTIRSMSAHACAPAGDTTCVILRPSQMNRLANAFPGLCSVALSLVPLVLGSGFERALVAGVVPGVILAVRGYRLSAETAQGQLVVHGYLRSRAIPRTAIVEVTDSSTVLWMDSSGKRRGTPILAFNTQPGTLPSVADHHAACRARLRKWVRGR